MENIEEAREWLAGATAVAVLTGAGISAESGIPTYRGPEGLWKQYRPEELETPQAFARNPRMIWEWYDWRRQGMKLAQPNAAHKALVQLEATKPEFTLITQNIDGLHDVAGSRRILKLHGDIWYMRCTACGANWQDRQTPLPKIPPHCRCGKMARPAVVWFGEALPDGIMAEAEDAVRSAEVLLVIGTSAVVQPAASLIPYAKYAGAKVIEVTLEATTVSDVVDCSLRGKAGEIVPQLI